MVCLTIFNYITVQCSKIRFKFIFLNPKKQDYVLPENCFEFRIQLPLKRFNTRFQRLFPNLSWLMSGRTSRSSHQKLVQTFPWINNCLIVTSKSLKAGASFEGAGGRHPPRKKKKEKKKEKKKKGKK